MSSSSPPFIALAMNGRASPAQIDDFVDRWHEEHGGRQLHDYLGLTDAEYALWLVEPDMLETIVMARVKGAQLAETVGDMLARRDGWGSGPAVDARLERLERWLAAQDPRG